MAQNVYCARCGIFPADAGVNLMESIRLMKTVNIPRGCGGEPREGYPDPTPGKYSPRMRGKTSVKMLYMMLIYVYE